MNRRRRKRERRPPNSQYLHSKNEYLNDDLITQHPQHADVIQQARQDPRSLSPSAVLHLQRTIGNQAVGRLFSTSPSIAPHSANNIIQKWPAEEVADQPAPSSFKAYKCHDAVVYWVLRSMAKDAEQARQALLLLHQKKGPSSDWIVEALGYTLTNRVKGPTDVAVGDILFTGHTSFVAHTMVVVDASHIKGYNNYGTFGTETGGDQYSTEDITREGLWQGEGTGKATMNEFPVYKISLNTAQSALRAYLETLPELEDYRSHMDVPNVPKQKGRGGCFITTAVTVARGLPDDCEELTILRAFRDSYLVKQLNQQSLVATYYEYSPLIVDAIDRQDHSVQVYQQLYDVIRDCVDAIKHGDHSFAYTAYCKMVRKLKDDYIPEVHIPPYAL